MLPKIRFSLVSGAVIILAGSLLGIPGVVASAAAGQHGEPASGVLPGVTAAARNHPVPRVGQGKATVRKVSIGKLPRVQLGPRHHLPPVPVLAPLGRDGRPAGAGLPKRPSSGRGTGTALRPNAAAVPRTPPSTVNTSFDGVAQAQANCVNPFTGQPIIDCPPDVTAAVGRNQILENVNLELAVYSKSGILQCSADLRAFYGNTFLSDPRVQYDNLNNRYIMDITVIPPTSTSVATMYVAASQTGNPCGGWNVFPLTFTGSQFPPGTVLDYPYLGQDYLSVNIATNNFIFQTQQLVGSTAFSIPKFDLYAGIPFSPPTFAVDFSTAPVTVAGVPIAATLATYWVAPLPGVGYDLFVMPSGGGPLFHQATVGAPYSRPSRLVNQPGSGGGLSPLDGRFPWQPVQDGVNVWFAHAVDPAGTGAISVRYGVINVLTSTAAVAVAKHSSTSDDWNPSIGVSDVLGGNIVWLNWAYTDAPNNVPTSDTVNGVLPGQGLPNEIGTDRTLITGSVTTTHFRFGDNSSVAIDPTPASLFCPVGFTAVTGQEYFTSDGNFATRIARLSFC